MGGLAIASRRATNGSSTPQASARAQLAAVPAVEVDDLHRRFDSVEALRGVSLEVEAGEVHGILGPNGAGKTTLMRILCGVVDPSSGSAYVLDRKAGRSRGLREQIGFVPSGDRSFYLRLSGLENLVFFARMHGLRRRAARERAAELLAAVGLGDAAGRSVNTYSHGMQKRLSFARALLHAPAVLLVDEATHDLDPVAAQQVRALALACAGRGAAVLWATQRIEELAGFAERVTVLDRGEVCFAGTVAALAAAGGGDRHIIGLGPRTTEGPPALDAALGSLARLQPVADAGHVMLVLAPGVSLGAALSALTGAGAEVTSCREERPAMESAFLAMTGKRAA
jgi:ABC-2 type transport system ATP-binding protein